MCKIVFCSPCGVGGVDRASSSDARGSGFEPRSVWKYHFFTPNHSDSQKIYRRISELCEGGGIKPKKLLYSL